MRQDPVSFVSAKRKGSCTPKEKALGGTAGRAEIIFRRAKLELSVRYASLPLPFCISEALRVFDTAPAPHRSVLVQQATFRCGGNRMIPASAAAALGAESIQISHAGNRRTHQRISAVSSFGASKTPFSSLARQRRKWRVWRISRPREAETAPANFHGNLELIFF